MVIAQLSGGLGNQMDQYSLGRCLAKKLNTDLKLDLSGCLNTLRSHAHYRLGDFNIQEVFATPEEIKRVKETGITPTSVKDLENIQGDIYIQGHWLHNPQLYKEIVDIIRKEFIIKKPFNPIANIWNQKILSAECSVSMHFRHGDYAYNPTRKGLSWAPILPLDYYCTCIDILKQRYNNLTVFVFSDNMPWVKENLHLDVPTEFVEGCETDSEEFILMSRCKHNIVASSTFSMRAAWLNSNPDKKLFAPGKSTKEEVKNFLVSLTPDKKKALLHTKGWIRVPYDFNNQAEITQRPIFSLLLIVNDDAANLSDTLDNLLNQDYKYYEIIIIDNASADGSDKICQETVTGKKNVAYKRLSEKVNNAAAWNEALKAAQGKYVLFLKVSDRFLTQSLTTLYLLNEYRQVDIIHMYFWLKENEDGEVDFAGKKFSAQRDEYFNQRKDLNQGKNGIINKNGIGAAQLLLNRQINSLLSTKIYNSEFLAKRKIKFDETFSDNEAELFFQLEAFFKSKYFMHIPYGYLLHA